ncbi:MAG: hypothetical protein HQL03_03740 [Nitrospirae bacterium]|nr:hypothetical protein [Nitrospirota bacterium]MBF0591775.1 hypothetical protein [Nitrospirota bacterium]
MVELIMKTLMMIFSLLFCMAIAVSSEPILTVAGATDSSFTQADRDRIIRIEEGLKATNQRLEDAIKAINQRFDTTNQKIDDGLKATNQRLEDAIKAINQRFDAVNQRFDAINQRFNDINNRIDDLRGVMYIMISVTVSGMIFIVGFALWDRRTILAPLARTTKEVEAQTEKLTLALKEKADKDPDLKEALRHAGLL